MRYSGRWSARAWPVALVTTMCLAGCATTASGPRAGAETAADAAARRAIATEAQLDVAKIPARSFAVLPFQAAAGDTLLAPLRFGLPALLIGDLAVSRSLQLVDRLDTDALLRELALVDAGVVDARTAPRVGRLVGARRVLLGDMSRPNARTIRLTARVVDVIAGTVQELVSAEAPLERILDAEKALAIMIFEKLGVTLTASERTRVERRQSTQLAALVAYGKGVDAEAHGDPLRARVAYREAARIDARFAEASRAATASPTGSRNAGIGIERVLGLSALAINAPLPSRLPEVADAPLSTGTLLSITFLIRVIP